MRENQRKSRAKKQEYVRELEQRLETSKEEAKVDYIKHLLTIQKLEVENKRLRALLGTLDISAESVQKYLDSDDQGSAADRKVAIPGTPRPGPSIMRRKSTRTRSKAQKVSDSETSIHKPNTSQQAPTESRTTKPKDLPFRESQSENQYEDTQDSDAEDIEQAEEKAIDITNTTLHTKAEELISQYNIRDMDIDEIWRRLAPAIIVDREDNCCRVQNQALFQILDEISGDI